MSSSSLNSNFNKENMIEPSFMDDIDLDISGDFFDHIDDLLDFPSEEVDGGILGDCNGFQGACPAPDALAGSGTVFSGNSTNSESELPTDFCVPHEDIAQLEWLSNFVEDSFSAGSITLDKSDYIGKDENNNNKDRHQFRTSSPVSVLESSSSCSGGKPTALLPETSIIPGRARSKRPRPTTFTARPRLPIISPTSSATDPATGVSSDLGLELESFAESHPSKKFLKPVATEDKKKKKKKLVGPPQAWADQSDSPEEPVAVRKCLHCQITKTPQWRAGPMGPKTLCNACGVRYKSGRLFPEYRPAASPTFVASLHSNSHKKVLEMRTNAGQKMEAAENVGTLPPEFIPKSSHLLDYA